MDRWTEDEIVRSYKNAVDRYAQIGILSDLTTRSRDEIRDILIRHGVLNKPVGREEALKERLKLYAAGLSDREIARRHGVSKSTIERWRNYHGLCVNREKKC